MVGLSRRRFLIGGGSVLATGLVAAGGLDLFDHSLVERGLHRFGLVSSPRVHFPRSEIVEHSGTLTS